MGLRKTALEPLREIVERDPPRNLPGMLSQLQADQAEQRRWAARDLAAEPEAAAALGERLAVEPDASVREALFTSLATIASPAAAQAVLPLLRSEDASLRNGAIEALAQMPRAAAPLIGALLCDADPDVRIFTVNLLGDLRHEQVSAWLSQVLAVEQQPNVVAAALDVLAEVGGEEHAEPLARIGQRFPDDPFIPFAAELALQRIRGA
jgi:HEAT repeat protein